MRICRQFSMGGVVLCIAIGACLSSSAPAVASLAHVFERSFGSEGSGDGQFLQPMGVAVNESSHDVYVVDYGNRRVEQFSPTGTFLGELKVINQLNQSERIIGVAVDNSSDPHDPSAGDVYVTTENGLHSLVKFSSTGVELGPVQAPMGIPNGVAVDSHGNLWVTRENVNEVVEFNDLTDNELISRWTHEANGCQRAANNEVEPQGLAVDSEDDVYMRCGQVDTIAKFSATGTLLNSEVGGVATATGVAVEQTGNTALIDEGGSVATFDPLGNSAPLGSPRFGSEGELVSGGGIAVDSTDGVVYVADASRDAIDVFAPVTLPDPVVQSPSQLTATGVTLNGVVNTNGVGEAACLFEYGETKPERTGILAYENYEFCTPESLSSGMEPVPVSLGLTGLAHDHLYHYRLVVLSENGRNFTSDQVFVTPPVTAGSALASGVTSFAATLTGVIGSGQLAPSYHFAYGLSSAYGSSAPLPDAQAGAGGLQTVSQTLTGLQPDTVYHFALVTTNFGGGVSVGPDETFTTRPLVPPAVSTAGAEAIGQTDATVTGAIDAEGLDTTYYFEYGPTAAYGSKWPSIEAHAGSGSVPEANADRIENLQPATTYHYRLVATNEDGTTYGSDQTFTTAERLTSTIQTAPLGGATWVVEEATSKPKSSGSTGHGKRRGHGKRKTHKKKAKHRKKG